MVRRWVCGVVVVAVIFGALGWPAPAMAKQPGDSFGNEFLIAVIGGGVLGASFRALGNILTEASSENTLLKSGMCYKSIDIVVIQYLWEIHDPFCIRLLEDTGYALGLGLSFSYVEVALGIEGNVIPAYLVAYLALIGSDLLAVFGYVSSHSYEPIYQPYELLHLPFVPAFLATFIFNMNAKMKDTGQPASLPWSLDLPVLSLEW